MQSDWAEEHSRALGEFLERGLSYSQIANAINERFNTAYSRNAAIGRARRLGLSGPGQPDRPARPKPQAKPGPVRLHKLRTRPFAKVGPPRPKVLERAAALRLRCVEVVPRHLSLLQLEDADCRYPYGGDKEGEAITFCGHPCRDGSSYCTSHFHLTSGLPARDSASASEQAAGRAHLRLVEAA
jgi:GcrA cell cycle regulator